VPSFRPKIGAPMRVGEHSLTQPLTGVPHGRVGCLDLAGRDTIQRYGQVVNAGLGHLLTVSFVHGSLAAASVVPLLDPVLDLSAGSLEDVDRVSRVVRSQAPNLTPTAGLTEREASRAVWLSSRRVG
jgi:hypothetical protein